jgi:TatD DNase family protein
MILEKGIPFDEIESGLVENQIKAVVQIASDPKAMDFSIPFCHEKSGRVEFYYTLGLHPNEAHELDIEAGIQIIHKHSSDNRFIGVGEIGLDFFYGLEHRDIQVKTFDRYLEMALLYKKPVVVHTRNAHDETVGFLKRYCDKIPFLIHCFTGNTAQMKDYLDLGAYISFSGIVTFKNALEIREAALYCPLDRMVVETDAPFLTPVPNRGQVNRPSWVRYVAEFVSQLRSKDIHTNLFENSIGFFNLPSI